MSKASKLFAMEYAPRTPDSKIDSAINDFIANGGKAKKLRTPDKHFRETPREKGAIYLSDREERLLDD